MANRFRTRLLLSLSAFIAILLLASCTGEAVGPLARVQDVGSDGGVAVDSLPSPEFDPLTEPLETPSEVPEELKTVWEVWALLAREHVNRSELDPEVFAEAAIRGMLQALDDPHTNYVRPEAFTIERQDIQGEFQGIGANVSLRQNGKLMIVAPLESSPAEIAGLRPGDVILAVNGESIVGLSLLEAVGRIRGPRGSEVRLLIQRLSSSDTMEVTVVRNVIPLTSVLLRSQPGDRFAHIRVTTFYPSTSQELAEAIEKSIAEGAVGLILDLRDNPGGLLDSVVDVSSQFLKEGLVLYQIDGSGRRKDWKVREEAGTLDIPTVVLTNEFSASASEILVGALQDHRRATIIGGTTFGKGSVNTLRRLNNGGGLYITFARWFTPSGRLIQGKGLEPDVEIVATDRQEAETLQLQKAFEVLESQIDGAQAASS